MEDNSLLGTNGMMRNTTWPNQLNKFNSWIIALLDPQSFLILCVFPLTVLSIGIIQNC